MNVQTMDWNDLRYVLAVARDGTLSGAARRLGVTHPTVFRRLGAIEKKLDTTLFERLRRGYRPTAAGSAVVEVAGRMEEEILAVERRLSGGNTHLSGVLRITTVDALLAPVLAEPLGRFARRYPEIQLELLVDNEAADLRRREADVAMRVAAEVPEHLERTRLSGVAHAVYASVDYLERHRDPDLSTHAWLALEESFGRTPFNRWIASAFPGARIALRGNTVMTLYETARAGFGLSVLPCFLGDPDPILRRVTEPNDALAEGLWLLAHPDLRMTTRVHAFVGFIEPEIAVLRALLEGHSCEG